MAVAKGTSMPMHTNSAGKLSRYGNARRLTILRLRRLVSELATERFARGYIAVLGYWSYMIFCSVKHESHRETPDDSPCRTLDD